MAKLYVQETSLCLQKENKEYIDICLCTYLRNEIQEINWLPLEGRLEDWGIGRRHFIVYSFVTFGF